MKAVVKWLDNMSFVGESESGHSVVMDGPPESGGRNLGVRPMEMVLLGMGGCTAFDVVLILQRQRQAISDCYVELSANPLWLLEVVRKKNVCGPWQSPMCTLLGLCHAAT